MSNLEIILFKSVFSIVPMILSLTVHEYAHAWVAFKLGDKTAQEEGRLTLNPLAHIDFLGTVLLPISLIASNIPISFGWAKPVPYDPRRFRKNIKENTGAMWVSAAGPLANFLMALFLTVLLGLFQRFSIMNLLPSSFFTASQSFISLFTQMIAVNVGLMLFNLIPLPPLDGAKVLTGLLPRNWAHSYEHFLSQFGMWTLLFVVMFGGRLIVIPMKFVLELLQNVVLTTIIG